MFDLPKLPKNLGKLEKVVEFVLDEYGLLIRPTASIILSSERLKSIDSEKEEFLEVLRYINSHGINAFNIYNDLPNSSKMGFEDNIVFKIRSDYLKDLRELLQQIESSGERDEVRQGDNSNQIISKPKNWGWYDKNKGEYQFGTITFQQAGDIRKKVFQSLINTFETSPQAISVKTISELTGLKPERVRIEISAINSRLTDEVGLYFKGSGSGYYTLRQLKSSSKASSVSG